MSEKQNDEIFAGAKMLMEEDGEAETLLDLAGYQVTKAELFAHTR